MEQEERRIGVGECRMVGHRARAADARIELAQIDLAAVLIDQEIEVEIAAIAFLPELVAELKAMSRALARTPSEKAPGKTSLPHQPPLYGVSS